jgi:hypothetical protein
MTQLELVEHDLTPWIDGLPIKRTIVAMSSSYSSLVEYCKETYGTDVKEDGMVSSSDSADIYYTIHSSKVVIVQPKI